MACDARARGQRTNPVTPCEKSAIGIGICSKLHRSTINCNDCRCSFEPSENGRPDFRQSAGVFAGLGLTSASQAACTLAACKGTLLL